MRDDVRNHAVEIVEDVSGGIAEDVKALCRQLRIATLVPFRAIAARMRFTIDFDSEPGCEMREVEDVRTERVLAAEFETFRALAEFSP